MTSSRAGWRLLCAVLAILGAVSAPPPARGQETGGDGSAEAAPGGEAGDSGEVRPGGRRRSGRQRTPMGMAKTSLAGKEIKILFAKDPVEGRNFAQLETLKAGEVVRFLDQPAIKLRTAGDLKFGDKTVKAGNIGPKYPGAYTLWLKKTAEGWSLVVNEDGDIWGTMHDPKKDVLEVPLAHAKAEANVASFTISAKTEGSAGELAISWGTNVWSAKFEAGGIAG